MVVSRGPGPNGPEPAHRESTSSSSWANGPGPTEEIGLGPKGSGPENHMNTRPGPRYHMKKRNQYGPEPRGPEP